MTPGKTFNHWHMGVDGVLALYMGQLWDMTYTAITSSLTLNWFLSHPSATSSIPYWCYLGYLTIKLFTFILLFPILRFWEIRLRQRHVLNKFQGVILTPTLCLVPLRKRRAFKFSQMMTSQAINEKILEANHACQVLGVKWSTGYRAAAFIEITVSAPREWISDFYSEGNRNGERSCIFAAKIPL